MWLEKRKRRNGFQTGTFGRGAGRSYNGWVVIGTHPELRALRYNVKSLHNVIYITHV